MPNITGSWCTLPQAAFEEKAADGVSFLHFRKAASRTSITALAATFGWPLIGHFISGSGEVPDFVLHRSEFPAQTGAASQRAAKLQDAIDAQLSATYENVLPPGALPGDAFTYLIVKNHVWNYLNDRNLMVPRSNLTGDFALSPIFDPRFGSPPANWWVGL